MKQAPLVYLNIKFQRTQLDDTPIGEIDGFINLIFNEKNMLNEVKQICRNKMKRYYIVTIKIQNQLKNFFLRLKRLKK